MRELIVDNFAGGGGASTGIEMAIGRSVDIAINHDPHAIAMHKTNHPDTLHYCESVFDIDPVVACGNRPVGLAWFSPDCRHFSKAKGKTPVQKEVRGLAWVVLRWALAKRPRVMMLENVEEFKTWGPLELDADGNYYPDKKRAGETFKAFVDMLGSGINKDHPALAEACEFLNISADSNEAQKLINGLRYQVDHRELRACDYGAPTKRKRFFMVMRCDKQKIVWPESTHGDPDSLLVKSKKLKSWRTAAECVDFSIPCQSVLGRKKMLAANTLKRIVKGFKKYALNNPTPFIARIGQTGFGKDGMSYDLCSPLTTVTTKAEHLLIAPVIIRQFGSSVGHAITEPNGTITCGGGGKSQLLAAMLFKYYGNEKTGINIEEPFHTVTTKDRFGLSTLELNNEQLTEEQRLNAWWCARLIEKYSDERDNNSLFPEGREPYIAVNGCVVVDLCMRMLQPKELYAAQGFPKWYVIDRDYKGNIYSKDKQVARCGNAVPPAFAEALVRSNLAELCEMSKVA